jgi:hypothetical protein
MIFLLILAFIVVAGLRIVQQYQRGTPMAIELRRMQMLTEVGSLIPS